MNAVLKALSSLIARYKVQLLTFPNKKYAIYTISGIIEKSRDHKIPEPDTYKTSSTDRGINIVRSAGERVGNSDSERLLKYFGTAKAVANASIEDLQTVEKIGPKKAQSIFEGFNFDYKEKEEFEEELTIDFDIDRDKVKENPELPEEKKSDILASPNFSDKEMIYVDWIINKNPDLNYEGISNLVNNRIEQLKGLIDRTAALYLIATDMGYKKIGICERCKINKELVPDSDCCVDCLKNPPKLKTGDGQDVNYFEYTGQDKTLVFNILSKFCKGKKQPLSFDKLFDGTNKYLKEKNKRQLTHIMLRQILRELEMESKIYQSTENNYEVF